jgi:hypothetical protein
MNGFFRFDLPGLGVVPPDWRATVLAAAEQNSRTVTFAEDPSSTTLDDDAAGLTYRVMDGRRVRRHLPWLYEAYRTRICRLVSEAFGGRYVPQEDIRGSITVNTLYEPGSRYERHVDETPATGVLYVTTMPEDEGGSTVFEAPDGIFTITPETGQFWVFDAREVPHSITALKVARPRVSVVMNFFGEGDEQVRPPGLDDYLYGPADPDDE